MTTMRVSFNAVATATLKENARVLVVLQDGVLRVKPSERDDPNEVTSALHRSGTSAYFTLTDKQQKRLQHLHGKMTTKVGDRIAFEIAPYRWLNPTVVNEVVLGAPMVTVRKN